MMSYANTSVALETTETYHLEIFGQFLNLNNFQGAIFAPTRGKVAIANDSYLIISDGIRMDGQSASSSDVNDINTLIEFSELSGKPTALTWISETEICVGYDTGTFACFDVIGNLVFERKFAGSAVQAMRMSDESSALDADRAGCLWIMYARGRLISVPVGSITNGCGDDCASFKFVENVVNVSDFVVPPFIYRPGVFDLDGSLDATYSLLVASDSDATLSLYNIGGKQQFQHLGKLGSYVKTQVTSAISKTFQNIFSFGSASQPKVKGALDKPPTTVALASLIDFEDSKRKVLRMRLDPSGSLVAASDNLGRVTLYDLRLNIVIRLWKGVRDARLAWSCTERESSIYLSLAIYAPQLGLLSFYAMRHGPCLRIVPIPSGAQCQIYTTVQPPTHPHLKHSHRLATCCLARGTDGSGLDSSDDETGNATEWSPSRGATSSEPHVMKIRVIVLDPYAHRPGDLDPCACAASTGTGAGVVSSSRQVDDKSASHSTSMGSLSGNALNEDALRTEQLPSLIPAERYGVTATSLTYGLSEPGHEPDKDLASSLSDDAHSLGDDNLPLPLSLPALLPLSPSMSTTRGSEDVVRTFRALIGELSLGTGERHSKGEAHGQSAPPVSNKQDEDILHRRVRDSESYLLSLSSSLTSLDALMECCMMVENVELTGRPLLEGNGLSKAVSNVICFSAAFHRTIHQTVTSVMASQNSSSIRALGAFGVEMAGRGRLLQAYSALAKRDSSLLSLSSSDALLDTTAERPINHYSSLNTSRAEALNWLHGSMRQSGLEAADKDMVSDRPSISFTLFCALNRTTHQQIRKLNSASAAAVAGESAAPSVTHALRTLLDLGLDAEMATLEVESSASLSSAKSRGSMEQVGAVTRIALPTSVRCEVFDFLSSPLLARDVFGLQNYSSALETIGLTCSSRLQLVLSCAVVHLQSVTKKALAIVLMSDVSSSPLQRWLRDSLFNLFEDYSTLTRMRAKSASITHNRDADTDMDTDRDTGLGDEEGAELTSPLTSKTRLSISDLEESLQEMLGATAATRESDPDLDPDHDSELELPSFDACTRYLLRRAWGTVRGSTHLVAMMAFVAMVNETLLGVSDQIERKSYGTSDLKTTISVWENLFRQLRVTIVLNSHMDTVGQPALTASINDYSHLKSSDISRSDQVLRSPSVYRVLALDTLSFAERAEDSVAHESQCKAVYMKKMQQMEQASKAASSSKKEKESDSVASMWGSSAESNWREMLPPLTSSRSGTGHSKKGGARSDSKAMTRRPLLLHFPLHNQPTILSTYRALELSHRWTQSTHRVGLLEAACEHLVGLSSVIQAAVAERIITEGLLPVTTFLVHHNQLQQQLSAFRDGDDVCAFCSAAIDLLHMAGTGSSELQQQQIQQQGDIPVQLPALPAEQVDRLNQLELESAGPLATWPPVEDSFFADLVVTFHRKSGCDLPTLHLHEAVFRVLQLCRMLRLNSEDPSPNPWVSKLFRSKDLSTLCLSLNHSKSETDTSREMFPDPAHQGDRLNFLRICFTSIALIGDVGADGNTDVDDPISRATSASTGDGCMLLSNTSSVSSSDIRLNATTVCYTLSDLWGVSVQVSRVLHLEALLDFDRTTHTSEHLHVHRHLCAYSRHDLSGSRDMEIENLIPLITDCALVIGMLISSLRRRIGRAVRSMEGQSCYGPLLAVTDSDAVTWCLHWTDERADRDRDTEVELPLKRKITGRSLSDGSEDSESSGAVRLNFNLGSTRNLVARTHSLLEAVSARGHQMRDSEVHCQALLALCDMLASLKV